MRLLLFCCDRIFSCILFDEAMLCSLRLCHIRLCNRNMQYVPANKKI